MKTSFIALTCVLLSVCGCSRQEQSPKPDFKAKAEESKPTSVPLANQTANQEAQKAERLPPMDKKEWVKQTKAQTSELMELARKRTPETRIAMSNRLLKLEAELPDELPSIQSLDPAGSRDMLWQISQITSLVYYLRELDYPESIATAKDFMSRFGKKYSGSDLGQKVHEGFEIEFQNAEAGLKRGIATWQQKPSDPKIDWP